VINQVFSTYERDLRWLLETKPYFLQNLLLLCEGRAKNLFLFWRHAVDIIAWEDQALYKTDPLLSAWLFMITKPVDETGKRILRPKDEVLNLNERSTDIEFIVPMLDLRKVCERISERGLPQGLEEEDEANSTMSSKLGNEP
jgi:hypothetical protein